MPDITHDNGVPVARTRRWERDRGFTRSAFIVVPEWEPLTREQTTDEAIALRTMVEELTPIFAHLDR